MAYEITGLGCGAVVVRLRYFRAQASGFCVVVANLRGSGALSSIRMNGLSLRGLGEHISFQ